MSSKVIEKNIIITNKKNSLGKLRKKIMKNLNVHRKNTKKTQIF